MSTRRPWRRRLRLARSMGLADLAMLARAFWLLPAVSLRLYARGFQSSTAAAGVRRRLVHTFAETPRAKMAKRGRARRTQRILAIAVRYSAYKGTCLSRSLTLAHLLRGQGIECDLRVGVRNNSKFEAHAWIELDGVVLNERNHIARHFVPIASATDGVVTAARIAGMGSS